MKLPKSAACMISFLSHCWSGSAYADTLASVYTTLEEPKCKLVSQDPETGDRTTSCPGIAGFSVVVEESDDRVSLTIISPNKKLLPLNFWDIAVPGFSTLGEQIEWRHALQRRTSTPVGIIVRVDTVMQANPGEPKPRSFFLVAHINENNACVTAKIPVEEFNAHLSARKAADDSTRRCLTSN